MSAKNSFFYFNRNQRKGLLILFILILVFQGIYFFVSFQENFIEENSEKTQWLSNQKWIDSLKNIEKQTRQIFPFNPNFISDFKGYQLGMSTTEIDRLIEFRKTNRYVNSAKEFQQITKISDSLLAIISPYFKFPEWTNNSKKNEPKSEKIKKTELKIPTKDLNVVSQYDLMKIQGIGEKLSERILKYRTILGAFASTEQLHEIYGLSDEVIQELQKYFVVSDISQIKKIRINELSIKELGAFPYFKYPISKEIVAYRSKNGSIQNIDDLTKIPNFPIDKIEIIAVYLEL